MTAMRELWASGNEARALSIELLRRARVATAEGGIWEAADLQWWWRRPRLSDDVEQPFWLHPDGPVASVLMTSWRADRWQCDPVLIPELADLDPGLVWNRANDLVSTHGRGAVEINLREDDRTFTQLVTAAGFEPGDQWALCWMAAEDRPQAQRIADGFTIVDRSIRAHDRHPMMERNGSHVAEYLQASSLYDPELDLAVETDDGRPAGYSLYWFDPITRVGLVEPMRVAEGFQRRGLASAMLAEGIDRLTRRGAERIKISFVTEAAAAAYQRAGFRPTHTVTNYRATLS